MNILSLSTTKSLSDGMQQCYEKNLKYCKLAFFTQTDICLTYMQGLSKRPIPGAGAPGIGLDNIFNLISPRVAEHDGG